MSNAVKLDQETEELKHAKLDLEVGKIIQQARNAKGITQVELARVNIFLFFRASFCLFSPKYFKLLKFKY